MFKDVNNWVLTSELSQIHHLEKKWICFVWLSQGIMGSVVIILDMEVCQQFVCVLRWVGWGGCIVI